MGDTLDHSKSFAASPARLRYHREVSNKARPRTAEMRIYRIHVDAALRPGEELALPERAANHLVKVLRHRTGDRIRLFDGRGREAEAEITAAHRRHGCRVRIIEAAEISRESNLVVELLPGISRGEKMDWVIQKSVELGVAAIRPLVTERSEVRLADNATRRMQRWREIVVAACEQSGRTVLPELHQPVPVERPVTQVRTRLALHPEAEARLGDCPPTRDAVAIAIGPEGGFSAGDLARLGDHGFRSVRFGPRVLRTETAGVAAVTALQVLYGDLDNR